MNKRDFIRNVTTVLREGNIRKTVSIPKQVFTISDKEGNSKNFEVKGKDKEILFTTDDIEKIIDAFLYVVKESIKQGEPVTFRGFGTFGLNYRKPRSTKSIETGERIEIKGQYVPKFYFGDELKMCARVYEMSLDDRLPDPDETSHEYYVEEDEE